MLYTDLDPLQKSQAECLFYDRLFGTNPAGFDYEIDTDGLVMGRTPLTLAGDHRQHQARGLLTVELSTETRAAHTECCETAARAMLDLTRAVALALAAQTYSPVERITK